MTDNAASFTNRSSWNISGAALEKAFDIPSVSIINDFQAAGYGLLTLGKGDVYTLQEGESGGDPSPIACIGAGTGLGECYLTPDSQGDYTCFSSEGGHAEFAPRNDLEMEMLLYLKKKFESKHR